MRYVPGDRILHNHRCENLETYVKKLGLKTHVKNLIIKFFVVKTGKLMQVTILSSRSGLSILNGSLSSLYPSHYTEFDTLLLQGVKQETYKIIFPKKFVTRNGQFHTQTCQSSVTSTAHGLFFIISAKLTIILLVCSITDTRSLLFSVTVHSYARVFSFFIHSKWIVLLQPFYDRRVVSNTIRQDYYYYYF